MTITEDPLRDRGAGGDGEGSHAPLSARARRRGNCCSITQADLGEARPRLRSRTEGGARGKRTAGSPRSRSVNVIQGRSRS